MFILFSFSGTKNEDKNSKLSQQFVYIVIKLRIIIMMAMDETIFNSIHFSHHHHHHNNEHLFARCNNIIHDNDDDDDDDNVYPSLFALFSF